MSIFADLTKGGVQGLFTGIGEGAKALREAITGEVILDQNKQAELIAKTMEIENSVLLAQLAVNKAEAESGSLFRGGWRPAVGWVCAFAFGCQFVIAPFIAWGFTLWNGKPVTLPALDMGVLMNLLFGMLGLGTLRTYEKLKGLS